MTAVLEPPPVAEATETVGRPEIIAAVAAFQAGDKAAFAVIYRQYWVLVISFIQHRIDGRQSQLAEDLAMDVFEKAFRRLERFSWQGADLGAWLVTIARNRVADHYKSAAFRRFTLTDLSWQGPDTFIEHDRADSGMESSPEQLTVDRAVAAIVAGAVQGLLTGEQHDVLVLRFYQGLSVRETCEVMGKNEGAVKALQYRAVRALARALPEGFEPW